MHSLAKRLMKITALLLVAVLCINAAYVCVAPASIAVYAEESEEELRDQKDDLAAKQEELENKRNESAATLEEQEAEKAVGAKEAEIAAYEEKMSDPDLYADPKKAAEVQKAYQQAQDDLLVLYEQWEAAEAALQEET